MSETNQIMRNDLKPGTIFRYLGPGWFGGGEGVSSLFYVEPEHPEGAYSEAMVSWPGSANQENPVRIEWAPPARRDLKPGTVFRYVWPFGKSGPLYVDELHPEYHGRDLPSLSIPGGSTWDDPVEVLWSPPPEPARILRRDLKPGTVYTYNLVLTSPIVWIVGDKDQQHPDMPKEYDGGLHSVTEHPGDLDTEVTVLWTPPPPLEPVKEPTRRRDLKPGTVFRYIGEPFAPEDTYCVDQLDPRTTQGMSITSDQSEHTLNREVEVIHGPASTLPEPVLRRDLAPGTIFRYLPHPGRGWDVFNRRGGKSNKFYAPPEHPAGDYSDAMCSLSEENCDNPVEVVWTPPAEQVPEQPSAPALHTIEEYETEGGEPMIRRLRVPGGWLYAWKLSGFWCAPSFVPDAGGAA